MPWTDDGMVVLYYDGRCGMCQRFRDAVKLLDRRRRVATMTLQEAHRRGRLPGLDEERFWSQFHLEMPDGTVRSGDDAIAPLLARLPLAVPAAWAIRRLPGAGAVSRWLYGLALARHGGPAEPDEPDAERARERGEGVGKDRDRPPTP